MERERGTGRLRQKRRVGHFYQVTPSVAAIQLNPVCSFISLLYSSRTQRAPLQYKEFDETALRGLLIMQLQPGLS